MSKPPIKRAAWFRHTDTSSIGIEIVVAVMVGALGGIYLEQNVTHWAPWTSLIGMALGLVAATRAVVRTARNYHRGIKEDAEAKANAKAKADAQGRQSPPKDP